MTFKEYKAIYGEDGYCSLGDLCIIQQESNPRSYRAILAHWYKALHKKIDKLEKELQKPKE